MNAESKFTPEMEREFQEDWEKASSDRTTVSSRHLWLRARLRSEEEVKEERERVLAALNTETFWISPDEKIRYYRHDKLLAAISGATNP